MKSKLTKFDEFKNDYNAYRNHLEPSTLSIEERTTKCLNYIPSNISGYDEGYMYYAFDLKKDQTIRVNSDTNVKNNIKSLWPTYNYRELTRGDILKFTHEAHRDIVAHLLHGLFLLFGKNEQFRNDLFDKKYFFRIGRGIIEEDTKQYWWVVQTIFPLDFDEKKNMVSYFSSILIEDRMREKIDMPFVNIIPNYALPISINNYHIIKKFQEHRYTIIEQIGFTKTESNILFELSKSIRNNKNITAKEIAAKVGISNLSAIHKHNTHILTKAVEFFHLKIGSFASLLDFVIFLQKNQFIP